MVSAWSEFVCGVCLVFETNRYCFHIHRYRPIFIRLGLDGPGFESWKGQKIFLHNAQAGSGAYPAFYLKGTGVVSRGEGCKAAAEIC